MNRIAEPADHMPYYCVGYSQAQNTNFSNITTEIMAEWQKIQPSARHETFPVA